MRTTVHTRVVSVLVLTALLLAGCSGDSFKLAFPRIEVVIDKEGNPTIAGVSPLVLRLVGVDLSNAKLDPALVQQMTDSNIQHVELLFQRNGLFWWVNAKPMTPLTWDDDSFNNTLDLAINFGLIDPAQVGLVRALVPQARNLEADVLIRFPLQDGATPIEPRPLGGPLPEPGTPAGQSVVAGLRLTFAADGTPSLAGVSTKDISQATGQDLSSMAIPADTMAQLAKAGIQHITIRTTPEGMRIWTNDKPLPTVRWSEETLKSTAELAGGLSMVDPALASVLKQFVPFANTLDVNIVLRFPTNGAAEIPLP
jgi:hypothetical protein